MILTLDMGNTNIVLGCIDDNDNMTCRARIMTDKRKTESEYAVILKSIFDIGGVVADDITGVAVSSVVPPLNEVIRRAVKTVTACDALFITVDSDTGLKINVDNPRQVGNDLLVAAVAALDIAPPPLIIIDMGTATTITAVDKGGTICGTAIMPGVEISLSALSSGTSQLPYIELDAPAGVIGKNTVDSMKSGVIYGAAAMLDGMIDRMAETMEGTPHVIATGGLSKLVVPYCRHRILCDEDLILKGLKILYYKN